MPVSSRDIYASAKLVIKKHGENALLEAMTKEEYFAQQGNLEAANTWHKIADAIAWMQMPENLSGETCH